jgi:hypothetical protein
MSEDICSSHQRHPSREKGNKSGNILYDETTEMYKEERNTIPAFLTA